jgi:DNA-binding transcriptional MocR family regulator
MTLPPRTGRYTRYAEAIQPSSIRALEELAARNPDLITFGAGRPDDSLFPTESVAAAYQKALTGFGDDHPLNYAPTNGLPALRDWIAGRERTRGRRCAAENVLITSGSQQAIHLVVRLLVEDGDLALVQTPTYPGALQVLTAHGARLASISQAAAAPSPMRPALIYAMADFQNPTGACLDLDERLALADLARRLDTVLVEDNAYEVLRYQGEAAPRLVDLDADDPDEGRGVYIGSFSKCAAPGLRLGWIVGPRALIAKLALIKQIEDLQSATLSQAVLVQIADEIMGPHAARLRAGYKARRDLMLEALRRHIGNRATWRDPEGGFFVWLTLDEDVDAGRLLPAAVEAGVAFVPGAAFFHDGSGAHHLRLSYSSVPPERIDEGIRRLASCLP